MPPFPTSMDLQAGPSPSPPSRIRQMRWAARFTTFLSSSRALSSGIFIILIVVTDHIVAAADGYMNKNLRGSYDPLIIGCVEGLVKLGMALVAYIAHSRLGYFSHREWTARAGWKGLLGVSFLIGVHDVLWALSSRGVQRQYEEAMTVIPVPLVLGVRFAWYEAFHIFHVAGALYASFGLLCTAYSTEVALEPSVSDVYYIFEQVVWALFLLSLAHWLGHNKRIPVFGLMVVFLTVQMACSTIGMVSLLGSGNIDSEAVLCLLAGSGCENAVPATLLAHAFASFLQSLSVVVVVKYVGAPITVVTLAASTCLRFYTHATPSSSVEVGAACVSVIGCAVFIHAQWILEVSHNEEWQDELRRSAASTSMIETSSEDDDDGLGPLVMQD